MDISAHTEEEDQMVIRNRLKNNNRGSATVYLAAAVIGAVALIVAFMFIRMNWRRFKADAGFAFEMAVIVLIVLLVILLLIRHSIRKN